MKLPDILILTGGKAKRLGKISKNIPKSLIIFNNKPFLFYQLKLLEKNNFKKIIISTGYLSNKIKNYITSINKNLKLKIVFSDDGKKILGTGGAIKKALPKLSNDFFIIFGDSYLDINYKKVYLNFIKSKKLGLMTVYKNNNFKDVLAEGGLSDVEIKNKEIISYDKKNTNKNMKYINYGITVLSKNVFKKYLFPKKMDLQKINQKLIKNNELSFQIIKKKFYEIGSKKGIALTKKYFKKM